MKNRFLSLEIKIRISHLNGHCHSTVVCPVSSSKDPFISLKCLFPYSDGIEAPNSNCLEKSHFPVNSHVYIYEFKTSFFSLTNLCFVNKNHRSPNIELKRLKEKFFLLHSWIVWHHEKLYCRRTCKTWKKSTLC